MKSLIPVHDLDGPNEGPSREKLEDIRPVRGRRRWPALAITAAAMATLSFGLSSCAVTLTGAGNCSPSNTASLKGAGYVTVQQAGRGQTIQWGVYPDPNSEFVNANEWIINVTPGNAPTDPKDQNYPPHGSVAASVAAAQSGKLLVINGHAYAPNGDTFFIDYSCWIA